MIDFKHKVFTEEYRKKVSWLDKDDYCEFQLRKYLIKFLRQLPDWDFIDDPTFNVSFGDYYILTKTEFELLQKLIHKDNFNNKFNELIK